MVQGKHTSNHLRHLTSSCQKEKGKNVFQQYKGSKNISSPLTQTFFFKKVACPDIFSSFTQYIQYMNSVGEYQIHFVRA